MLRGKVIKMEFYVAFLIAAIFLTFGEVINASNNNIIDSGVGGLF